MIFKGAHRFQKSAEQQGQSVEGAGDGSKQGLRLEPDSGENQGRAYCK